MPLLRSNTADKIIVDRRKPHRNSDVARAVQEDARPARTSARQPDFRPRTAEASRALDGQRRRRHSGDGAGDRGRRILRRHEERNSRLDADCARRLCGAGAGRPQRRPDRHVAPRRRIDAAQFPDRAFRQRARLDLFRADRLRRVPGRPVPGRQGDRAPARHRRDGADRLVAARRARRDIRPAGRGLRLSRRASLDAGRDHGDGAARRVAALLRLSSPVT